jgi:hypothetical protein
MFLTMKPTARRAFAIAMALGLLSACGDAGTSATGGSGGSGGDGGRGGDGDGAGVGGDAPLDRSNVSFADNLLFKVETGEWTLGEGIVATLELFAGETEEEDVLRVTELVRRDATGIYAMAREYLEDGPDTEAKAEIARLLGRLWFSNAQLEAMAGIDSSGLVEKGAAEDDCTLFFTGNELGPGIAKCLEVRTSTKLESMYPGEQYRVFAPAPPLPQVGWTDAHYDLALKALEESVPVLKKLGELRDVNVIFAGTTVSPAGAAAGTEERPCGAVVYVSMQKATPGDFKQTIAHEVAHCFNVESFPEPFLDVPWQAKRWWDEGLAEYLSNVVYPENNAEWKLLLTLSAWELASTPFERAYTNFAFFQHLSNHVGTLGTLGLIQSLGTSSTEAAYATKVAAYPNMDSIYHDFARRLTDKTLADTSGAMLPYPMRDINRPTVDMSSSPVIMEDFKPFNVSRYRLTVPDNKEATLAFTKRGELREAARSEVGKDWGGVPTSLPDKCEQVILVATTTEPGSSYELEAPVVEDSEASCRIAGTWVVDNDSLQFKEDFWTLEHVTGQVSVTFKSDGTATVVYDDFETKFSKKTELYQELLETLVTRFEENTFTTNATGTTSYEIMGDEIYFGDLFESDYLVGVKTHHYVRRFEPQGIIGNNSEQTFKEHPDGLYLFSAFVKFDREPEPGGAVMRFLGINDRVDAVLHRTEASP